MTAEEARALDRIRDGKATDEDWDIAKPYVDAITVGYRDCIARLNQLVKRVNDFVYDVQQNIDELIEEADILTETEPEKDRTWPFEVL